MFIFHFLFFTFPIFFLISPMLSFSFPQQTPLIPIFFLFFLFYSHFFPHFPFYFLPSIFPSPIFSFIFSSSPLFPFLFFIFHLIFSLSLTCGRLLPLPAAPLLAIVIFDADSHSLLQPYFPLIISSLFLSLSLSLSSFLPHHLPRSLTMTIILPSLSSDDCCYCGFLLTTSFFST